ncbi:Eukaryotic translation initiation factor 3 subunit H [Liparis tanakae]|uniref:Eukaryotic translation initiation factor 3 subunit H n=1 Tax=Liparis tanakae TaxID=230148 RepID=A0A4Z2ETH2_9TELE|nr:Eukaryotic translation initiation factor 3 subunit H [Liparis tanakae]
MASRKESGAALPPAAASTSGTLDSPVKQIQIEGLVSVPVFRVSGRCYRARCYRSPALAAVGIVVADGRRPLRAVSVRVSPFHHRS